MPLVILEGCDGAGKSTVANELAQRLNECEVLHFSQPKQHPLAEYELTLDARDYWPVMDAVVCDRFHWGEMIYSELYRDGSQLGEAGYWHVEQYLRSRGAVMVHVTAPLGVIQARIKARGEDYLQPEHVARVRTAFIQRAITSYQEVINVDTWLPIAGVLDRIVTQARLRAAWIDELPTSYVGPAHPALVLVGDEPNTQPGLNHEAAFPPYPGSSARYLIENVILPLPRARRGAIGLVNSLHHGGVPIDLRDMWKRLGSPTLVALGQRAHERLDSFGLPHGQAAHPQYRRRFHNAAGDEYREQILGEARWSTVKTT